MQYNIDTEKIANELEFDIEDVEMLLEVFINSANQNLNILKEAIKDNDFETIRSSSHAIKGSAANLKLENISKVALQIELLSKDETNADYQNLYEDLKNKIDDLTL